MAAAAAAMAGMGQISRAMASIGRAGGSANQATQALSRLSSSADQTSNSFGGLIGAIHQAASALRAFGRLQDTLGSSAGETAALRIVGRALGLGDIRGMAANLRQNSLSGLGAATATRFGIPIRPNDVGSAANEGDFLLKALQGLRNTFAAAGGGERGRSAALADARNLGIESAIEVIRISDEMWGQILKDAKETQALLGPEHQARAVALSVSMSRLSEKWQFLSVLFQSQFIPILQKVTDGIISLLRFLSALPGSGVKQGEIDAALNANTSALGQNTRALDNMSGIYGGGRRARGAIPGAFGPGAGYALQGALRAHGLRLGYYSVGI